ncbi:MAG: DUF3363 domain-containing protein, partial [Bradyrhizobium sp.]|nr:DUF3363 domain-containing protein [Bradyrhizobium sp.]
KSGSFIWGSRPQWHHIPVSTAATLERREVERVGRQIASEQGLTYMPNNSGEHISGRLAGVASLISGRFAMIDSGLGFQLVPWLPLLHKPIGQQITGLQRDEGEIEWTLGSNRGEPVAARVHPIPAVNLEDCCQ